MANVIQIKRSATHNATTAPTNLAVGELGYVQGSKELYICRSTDNTGGKEVIHAAAPRHGVNTIVTVGEVVTGTWKADTVAATYLPKLNGITGPDGDVAFATNKITGLGDPTNAQDAATKAYVDASAQGLDVKESVRVASTADMDIAGASNDLNTGEALDGVTLATGDRVLVKNQSTGSENGIYVVVGASAAPTRATDFNENDEVSGGTFTFVEEGTANADSGWVVTTDGAIVVGTTALAFAQFSGAGQITAGAGLTKAGNALSVNVDDSTIEISGDTLGVKAIGNSKWDSSDLAITNGGTGASSAPAARTALGLAIGSNVQAYDADLSALAGLATTDGNFIVGNGSAWVAESGGVVRNSLGLGDLAEQNNVDNDDWSGNDLAVVNGGTGVSTLTTNQLILGRGTSAVVALAAGSQYEVLQSNGASSDPVWVSALTSVTIDCGTF
jgi:hypothetical protein